MTRYLLGRFLGLALVLLGISALVFAMASLLPGDPATAILGPYATPERVEALRHHFGLQASLPQRYLAWLSNLLSGDFGHSYALDRPVLEVIGERIVPTLELGTSALLLGSLLGLCAGSVAAVHRGSFVDRLLTLGAVVGISTPSFWMAMLLVLLFSVELQVLPVSGMSSVAGPGAGGSLDVAAHLVLPALALGLVVAGVIARFTRTAMLETLAQEYVRLARAKGLPEGEVVYGHAFRVVFSRVVPVLGLQAGFVLGGTVYIETVFQWPGLGKLLVDAILQRDLLLTQGIVVVVASCYVLVNLGTDLLQRALDPRITA